MKKSFSRTN